MKWIWQPSHPSKTRPVGWPANCKSPNTSQQTFPVPTKTLFNLYKKTGIKFVLRSPKPQLSLGDDKDVVAAASEENTAGAKPQRLGLKLKQIVNFHSILTSILMHSVYICWHLEVVLSQHCKGIAKKRFTSSGVLLNGVFSRFLLKIHLSTKLPLKKRKHGSLEEKLFRVRLFHRNNSLGISSFDKSQFSWISEF